ncbi:MAG: hypothetical protein ACFB10_26555 [Salibacteraceae bacterium]
MAQDTCSVPKDEVITFDQEMAWSGSWDSLLRASGATELGEALIGRSFDIQKLEDYIGKDSLGKDSLVIRLYCGTATTPQEGFAYVPDLILVKGGPCNEDKTSALLATATGTSTVTIDKASGYIKTYAGHMKQVDLPGNISYEIAARTFSMRTVVDFIERDEYAQLSFYFMLRPNGSKPKDGPQPLLFDMCMMGFETYSTQTVYVNFAQHCPRLCDFESLLYQSTQ